MMNWNSYLGEVMGRVGELAKLNPELGKSLQTLGNAPAKTGHLDGKIHELISLAVAVTTRCDGCIASHVKAAVEKGATKEEVAEAMAVAISLNAGAAVTYSARVMDAFAEFSEK